VRTPRAPRLDTRRTAGISAELRERARSWIPSWALADGERDFGRALLEIAARFSSEVAERLDDAGEKMRRGFLDWLAVRGQAARPARMPVVFKLADAARDAVLASAPVRMQADAAGTSVVFETETDVRLVPGSLQVLVGVDADADAFFLPPPGLSDLKPLEPLPVQWQLKSFAAAGATKLQLDPEAGLLLGIVIEAAGQQYRIEKADKEIVTVNPPLTAALDAGEVLHKVTSFTPFDDKSRNRQEHALYVGHKELLDITSPAAIAIAGAQSLQAGVTWQYWGKAGDNEAEDWQPLLLAKDQPTGAVLLTKGKGAVEPREVSGRNSRWIRALTKNIPPGTAARSLEDLRIRINAVGCDTDIACRDDLGESPAAEGLANTTPLVLESVFSPLGREPRQFDAFYLGSAEAFSKPGAKVQLCFQMSDPSFESLAVQHRGLFEDQLLAGVALDGHLHLLRFDPSTGQLARDGDPLRPPSPGPSGVVVAGPPVNLDPRPNYRAAMWTAGQFFGISYLVAVAANGTVWAWRHPALAPALSGWESYGVVEPVNDTTQQIAGIVHLDNGVNGLLYVLREKKLFVRDLDNVNGTWQKVTTEDGGGITINLETIAPVVARNAFGWVPGSFTEGLVGVDENNALYAVTFAIDPTVGTCAQLVTNVNIAKDVVPAGVQLGGDLAVVAVDDTHQKFVGYQSTLANPKVVQLDGSPIGHSVDAILDGGKFTFAVTLRIDPQSTVLARWTPFDSSVADPPLFTTIIPATAGAAGGAPTQLPAHVVVPAETSVLVAGIDPNRRQTFHTTLRSALIASSPAEQLASNDNVAIPFDNNGVTAWQLENVPAPVTRGGETLYAFNIDSVNDAVFVYRAAAPPFFATANTTTNITIDPTDLTTGPNTILLITTDHSTALYTVTNAAGDVAPPLDVLNPANLPLNFSYQVPETSTAQFVPLLDLNPATDGNWQASLLASTNLIFPGADPELQDGTAWQVDTNSGKPQLVVLGEHWVTHPPDTGFGTEFVVDGSIGDWSSQLGDTSSNPALSWEYGNGTGWWKLDPVQDETLNLKRTGAVRFVIPDDLRPMDWAGRTNYWIRARLIGGDYGKETVKVTTTQSGNTSTQTIDRSTEGIRPPSVVKLHISYRLCAGVLPTFVLAQDSGSIRDQSDANRTPGAIVEAFVPLGLAVGRLSNPAVATETPETCPPPCECSSGQDAATAAAVASPAGTRQATGRSLFIGLNAALSGAPINVLLLVDREAPHEQFAPMKIEALVADRFVPVVADDSTRALGESGLLEMAFAVEPTPRELFGMDDLTWLRLTPGGSGTTSDWKPAIRGAYLNAVFASAAETLTRELLGSSEGAPELTFFLARPPVLRDTLELRVKEPLGDEERIELREGDETRVLSAVDGLPGDWVRWERVIDPGDESPAARVYALDESNGEIRFGDGQHGRIPPIGRDSIVAFSYKRTELGKSGGDSVPANSITARTTLNLVSPVESVEAVFAADQAAGGAPPESDERVLRFGTARLRHRQRAVTANDFEDLALESSPDIVQARCFVRPGKVQLVVVMRGENPLPNAAQVRELRRLLLAAAPASLGALQITGPRIRRLRIVLDLLVASLDVAGDVSRTVEQRIRALFDTATGGTNKEGWALGEVPSEEDVALALIDTRRLEGIEGVTLLEVLAGGTERPWTAAMKQDELAMLDKDALRLGFQVVEVLA